MRHTSFCFQLLGRGTWAPRVGQSALIFLCITEQRCYINYVRRSGASALPAPAEATFGGATRKETRGQSVVHQGNINNNMPKFILSFEIKKISSKARLLKRSIPAYRLQAMISLLQSVENRIYHNKQAACRAKNVINAVGILLQSYLRSWIPLIRSTTDTTMCCSIMVRNFSCFTTKRLSGAYKILLGKSFPLLILR